MTGGLEGRVAIVTGATGGIGGAIARTLAGAGASCILLGRDLEKGRALVGAIGAGERVLFESCDVVRAAEVDRVVALAKERFGGVHILVNNAGITRDGLLLRMKEEDWDTVLAVNLKSVYILTKAVAGLMVKARYGRVVNITSIVGVVGNAGQANYAASKAGIIGFTKSVAKELAPRGITVNAVAPGFIETPMTDALSEDARRALLGRIPAGRFGTPDDVAHAVHYLASDQAGYVTGQVLGVDGMLSV
jgi:3-oxoacyl-[acyl-carrier protein] reductase